MNGHRTVGLISLSPVHRVIYRQIRHLLALLLLSSLTHATAAQTLKFEDVSERAGIATNGSSQGAAVHDFDGDGWDDVYVAVTQGTSALFRNNKDGTFTDVAADAGVAVTGGYTVALWGDVDNDGNTDLFVGRKTSGENKLFLGNGDGTYMDGTAASGLSVGANLASAAFGDFDGDGFLDLFLAVDRAADILYRNTGGSAATRFEDVTERAGISGQPQSVPMQATWADYDRDGDLDLFCVHDSRTPSRLYRNSGYLPLSDVASSARIDTYPTETTCCNMGIAWGDYNSDGWLDAYVTRIGWGGLYRNNGDGTFDDVAESLGADRNGMSWGVVFNDFDNDTDLDLFIVSTSGYDGTPTLLYRNDGSMFTETGAAAGASYLMEAQGLASGDFNNDGLVDIFIPRHDGSNRLLENVSQNPGHWAQFTLKSEAFGGPAIGTRVEAHVGDRVLVRVVSGGDSYASQSSSRIHFGLGAATRIDTLRVYWAGSVMEEVVDLAADRTYTLTQGLSTADEPPPGLPTGEPSMYNYPNPFAATTEIRYDVATPGLVRLDIYDLLGRRVVRLVDEFKTAGSYTATFDGRDLPPSTYFYRLTSDGRTSARTMLLAR